MDPSGPVYLSSAYVRWAASVAIVALIVVPGAAGVLLFIAVPPSAQMLAIACSAGVILAGLWALERVSR